MNGKHLQWLLKKKHAHTTAFFFGHCYYMNYEDGNGIFAIHPAWERKKVARGRNLLAVDCQALKWQTGYGFPAMTTGFNHSRRILPKDLNLCVNTDTVFRFDSLLEQPENWQVAKNSVVGGVVFRGWRFPCLITGPGPWGPRILPHELTPLRLQEGDALCVAMAASCCGGVECQVMSMFFGRME